MTCNDPEGSILVSHKEIVKFHWKFTFKNKTQPHFIRSLQGVVLIINTARERRKENNKPFLKMSLTMLNFAF